MNNKMKNIIAKILVTAFILTSLSTTNVIAAFKPYNVIITASTLNVRQAPSALSKVVSYFKKGSVVSVLGQAGSFLKTSKGYIHSSYTKKYTVPSTGKISATTFKSYKAVVTASKLTIRQTASTSGKIVGYYVKGNVVSIIGKSGSFLRTSKGYIYASYTKVYTTSSTSSTKSTTTSTSSNYVGRYIIINKDTKLILNTTSKTTDERYAIAGKKYKIYQNYGSYYRIKVGKVYGYVPKSNVSLLSTNPRDRFTIIWDYIYTASSNKSHYDSSSDYLRKNSTSYGIDAMSPTWFDMTGSTSNPTMVNKADRGYVTTAHRYGYEVWPRFAEMNKSRASTIFNNKTIRTRVINDIVSKARTYNVDGINIDFEALGSVNKNGFTNFTKDLAYQLKKYGIGVSVDVTKPVTNSDLWSACYDRPALAKYVDHIIFMGYDQNGSSTVGPGGSYAWIEDGIKKIIASGVPKNKLALAVPFYMRDYKVQDSADTSSVVFTSPGKVYKTPYAVDNNKAGDLKSGEAYNSLGSYDNIFTKVDYNGKTVYVKTVDIVSVSANTPVTGIDVLFPYDTVVAKEDTPIYKGTNEVESEKAGDIKTGNPLKYLDKTEDGNWYIVEYNGANAFMPIAKGDYLPANTAISTVNPANSIVLTYDAAVIKNNTVAYLNPVIMEVNVVQSANTNDSFKLISNQSTAAAPYNSFYLVETKTGARGYALKSATTYKPKTTKVISSTAISISSAASYISKYNARVTYDSNLKQNVAQYYSGGYRHIIYVEDKITMNWRSDLINKYGLAGMGIWQLGFTPTNDIWTIIRTKMD